jgi:predicted dehydrogenase
MKFVIAGLGSIGRRHLRNLVALGEKDIVLYRTHQASLPDTDLADFPVESELEKVLALKPDAVIVSNPTALHLRVAIPAAQAGCSLMLEKPLSVTCEGLDTLQDALQVQQKQALVGFQFRFHPAFLQIAEWLKQGEIGEILSTHVHWGEYLPGWHPWEDYRTSYSARKDLGGGVVLTLCHPIDYVRWLMGEVQSVSAYVGQISSLELEVEDIAEITMRHSSGALSHIHLDYYQQPKHHALEIVGERGTIRWEEKTNKALLLRPGASQPVSFQPASSFERNDLFLAEMTHFLSVIKEGEPPLCTLHDGMRVQQIIAAVYQSSLQQQQEVSLPQNPWSESE